MAMQCHGCGLIGEDLEDFEPTPELGERVCSRCGSTECYEDDGSQEPRPQ
jgi:hypothetical protein